MSINLRVKLFKGKTYADGTHPIQLQFYNNGKYVRKGVYNCHAADWDEKKSRVKGTVKNASYINGLISEKYTEYERELIKLLNDGKSTSNFFESKKDITVTQAIQLEIDRYKAENKPGTYLRITSYLNQLQTLSDLSNWNVNKVDIKWFQKYASLLNHSEIAHGKIIRKANKGITINKKIKTVRRIVEIYAGVNHPEEIKKFKVTARKSIKQKLTTIELSLVTDLNLLEGSVLFVVRDLFLLQIYLRGSRIGALIQAYSDQFKDGRYLPINAEGKNIVGSKIIPQAEVIIGRYKGKYKRLFPFFTWEENKSLSPFENNLAKTQHIKDCTSAINMNLKRLGEKAGITKPLSSHIARHTFARMAIDKINNPMVTMELLGHASLAVHQAYLNDIRKDDMLDAAADEIFG